MRGCFLGCLAEIGLQRRKKNKTSKITMSNNISNSNKDRNATMLRILKVQKRQCESESGKDQQMQVNCLEFGHRGDGVQRCKVQNPRPCSHFRKLAHTLLNNFYCGLSNLDNARILVLS